MLPFSFVINGVLQCLYLVFLCVICFLYLFFVRLLTFCMFILRIAHVMHQRAMALAFSATPMLIQATAT